MAAAEQAPARWAPSVGLALGYSPERLELQFPGQRYSEDRELWNSRVGLGIDGRFRRLLADLDLRSVTELGYGLVHQTGHGLLEVTQAGQLEYPLGAGFAIPFGLSLSGTLNTSAAERSSLTWGFPVGIRFRAVELWYRPGLVFPLGEEAEPVFSGERKLSARPGWNWLDFGLRVRLSFLEF